MSFSEGMDLSSMEDSELKKYIKAMEAQLEQREVERQKYQQSEDDFCEMRRAAIAHSLMELLVDPEYRHMKAAQLLAGFNDWERSERDFSTTPKYPNDQELLRRLEDESVKPRMPEKSSLGMTATEVMIQQKYAEDASRKMAQRIGELITKSLKEKGGLPMLPPAFKATGPELDALRYFLEGREKQK